MKKFQHLTDYEDKVLTMLSAEVLNGKRKHEIILIEMLLKQAEVSHDAYLEQLVANDCRTDEETLNSVNRILDLSFFTQANKKKYGEKPIVELDEDGRYLFNTSIQEELSEESILQKTS